MIVWISVAKGNSGDRDINFWGALLLIALTFILVLAVYYRLFFPNFFIGPFRVPHWFGWIGTLYIAIFIPIFHFLKLKRPKRYMMLLRFHIFGNLLSAALISIHFTQQLTRPSQAYPELGTGVVLILVLILLVSTGLLQRFGGNAVNRKRLRFIHTGTTIAFYLVTFVHILHGLGLI